MIFDYLLILGKATLFLILYIGLWLFLNKIIENKIFKSILIGLITPFFFYHLLINFTFIIFGYPIYVEEVRDDGTSGALLGITYIIAKPLSILAGVLLTIFLLLKKQLSKMLNDDLYHIIESQQKK